VGAEDGAASKMGTEAISARSSAARIAVIIPCYRVRATILEVVRATLPFADDVFCVDDRCPEESGDAVAEAFAAEPGVHVIRREKNGGVGAATVTGYRAAMEAGADILVKVDGDGQMNPQLIPDLVQPILAGETDYMKGNRFFSIETVAQMPWARVIGNAGLSFFSKLSTGYWDLFDPTNGFTAIQARIARELPMEKLHPRYFFESDMLFRLGVLRASVAELPDVAHYGEERSNLSQLHSLATFPLLHLRNFAKRVAYNYFLRNFSIASLNLLAGLALLLFGTIFGARHWTTSVETGFASTAGTVMVAALPVILGIQLLLSFISHDISMTPTRALHPRLPTSQLTHEKDAK
jgi:glycosyltransferase involved in cell wall biosynthesis